MIKSFSALAFFAVASFAAAGPVVWTDWVTAGTTVDGVLSLPGGPVTVAFSGSYDFAQIGAPGEPDYFTPSAPYVSAEIANAPTAGEMIGLNQPGTRTITFSEPVLNPYIAFVSVGTGSNPVSYTFSSPITKISEGAGYWGNGSAVFTANSFTGAEWHGVARVDGLVSSITFVTDPGEYWHGITVGAAPVPEPASMAVLGLGLAALKRRRKSA